jgi:phosphatidylglycerol---prolipoprotein diacylglyceryl transferase
MFMVGYFSWRLLVDFLKPDPKFFTLNSIQWACVAVLIFYSRDVVRWFSSPARANATSAAQGHS